MDWASFSLVELLAGFEQTDEACCVSLCWLSGRELYLYNCRESGRTTPGSFAGRKPKGGGSSSRTEVGLSVWEFIVFLEQYLLQACASSGTRTRGAEKPPKEGHPLGVSYIYIHIDT